MKFRRSDASADVYNNKIYVVGGFNGVNIMNSGEFYSPKTNQWTMIASMNVPRSGFRLINYCSQLYAIAGNSQRVRLSSGMVNYLLFFNYTILIFLINLILLIQLLISIQLKNTVTRKSDGNSSKV